jgi:hypothetical protein
LAKFRRLEAIPSIKDDESEKSLVDSRKSHYSSPDSTLQLALPASARERVEEGSSEAETDELKSEEEIDDSEWFLGRFENIEQLFYNF